MKNREDQVAESGLPSLPLSHGEFCFEVNGQKAVSQFTIITVAASN